MKSAHPRRHWLAVLPLVGLLASGSAGAEASRADGEFGTLRKTYDLVVLRPLDLTTLVVSAGFFALAYPVALVTGGSDFVREVCITLPVERAFLRPLGEL